MKPYIINREQYRKIKKMDHQQLSDWLRRFTKNYYEKVKGKIKQDTIEIISKDYDITEKSSDELYLSYEENKKYMKQALEGVKGIGAKREQEFLNIYDELLGKAQENLKDKNVAN